MKYLLLLLVALAAAQLTVGLKSAEINGEGRLLRSKGDDDEYSGKGKGKGKGKGYDPDYTEKVEDGEKILKYYADGTGNQLFNLNKTHPCGDNEIPCVGAVLPFKDPLYFDKYFHYPAGFIIGHCIIVAEHPYPYMYCEISFVVEEKHEFELALQGYATLNGKDNTLLISGAGGALAGEKGEVTADPADMNKEGEPITKFVYTIDLYSDDE
jgi:hypothetical protein